VADDGERDIRVVDIVDIDVFAVSFEMNDQESVFALRQMFKGLSQVQQFSGFTGTPMPSAQEMKRCVRPTDSIRQRGDDIALAKGGQGWVSPYLFCFVSS
jgi:hypothetical protein